MQRRGGKMSVPTQIARYERWAKEHYENFTVGSLLLPRRLRRPVRLLYAYCRYVDDLGDEAAGDRLQLLDAFESELLKCFDGAPSHPLLVKLQPVIREFNLPARPFLKLVEANRMDQHRHRYRTFADLLTYCEHSANPVGHLFLALLGYSDAERIRLSDATCIGLQLVNILQDIPVDFEKGRIYLPEEDMEHFGVTEAQIARGEVTEGFLRLMAFECDMAEAFLLQGMPLATTLPGLAKYDVRLFSYGGLAALRQLRSCEYDVFSRRPKVSKAQKTLLALRAVGWLLLQDGAVHAREDFQ